ncbi:hypothetical protein ACTWQF_24755 [Streptomyces sp. 8N114]|uniref:hypothetical protein n=1 Tax=Streptomyces sp. 8N114 TaxID=3457419 RepID=UPI003FD49ECB
MRAYQSRCPSCNCSRNRSRSDPTPHRRRSAWTGGDVAVGAGVVVVPVTVGAMHFGWGGAVVCGLLGGLAFS